MRYLVLLPILLTCGCNGLHKLTDGTNRDKPAQAQQAENQPPDLSVYLELINAGMDAAENGLRIANESKG